MKAQDSILEWLEFGLVSQHVHGFDKAIAANNRVCLNPHAEVEPHRSEADLIDDGWEYLSILAKPW